MCDCNKPVEHDSSEDIITRGVARRLANYCSGEACSQSEAMARLEALSRGTLTRANSRVVATRVPLETAKRIARFATAHHVAPHVFLRQALALLTASPSTPDAEGILADLIKALGLPELTRPNVVLNELKDLFAALGVPVGDALQAAADAPPAELSRGELAAMTPADRGRHLIQADAARRARRAAGDTALANNLATRNR